MPRPSCWPSALLRLAWPLLLSACANASLELAPEQPDRPWRPATDAGGAILPAPPLPAASAAGASHVLPSNTALAALPPPPALDAEHVYTLPELIDIAQSNNHETRIAWNVARNAALAAGIAQSSLLPQVSASVVGGYQRARTGNGVQGINLADNEFSGSGAISALSLQWLLFDFGQRAAVIEAARQVSVISNIGFTAAHQRLIHEVSLAFYANAAARAHVEIAAQVLRNALEVEAAAEARYKQGIGTVIEVAQARQVTAQARLGQVQAQGAAQDTYLVLLTAMGVSPLARIQLADLSDRKLTIDMAEPVDRIVSEALARRPDMLGAYAAQQASAAGVAAAQAEFLPKVFLSATGSYNSGRLGVTTLPAFGEQPPTLNIAGTRYGAVVLLGITIPIYDGGLRDATLRQARANADKAAATLEKTRDDAVRQIVGAQNALRTSLSAGDAAAVLETAAQTSFDASLDAYRHGMGSITDVNLAQSQLLLARKAASDARSAALAAAATLAFATGGLGAAPQAGR